MASDIFLEHVYIYMKNSGRFRKIKLHAQLRYFLENGLKSAEFACTSSNFVFFTCRANSACICACCNGAHNIIVLSVYNCFECIFLFRFGTNLSQNLSIHPQKFNL